MSYITLQLVIHRIAALGCVSCGAWALHGHALIIKWVEYSLDAVFSRPGIGQALNMMYAGLAASIGDLLVMRGYRDDDRGDGGVRPPIRYLKNVSTEIACAWTYAIFLLQRYNYSIINCRC